MLLQLSTWTDIETYLERSKAILIPIGSTEQHGPNGLLGTDFLCPEIIAGKAAETADMLIAPTFNVGCAQHHLAFPGSISLRPSTMIAAMSDWIASFARHGFERLYWFNGHGGNIATIGAAFAEVYAGSSFSRKAGDGTELALKSKNWWQLPGVAALCREIYPVGDGLHATASEVAVTFSAYPGAARQVEMSPKIAPLGEFRDALHYRSQFPDGRIGSDPSQAAAADGERIVAAAAAALAADFKAFASGSQSGSQSGDCCGN